MKIGRIIALALALLLMSGCALAEQATEGATDETAAQTTGETTEQAAEDDRPYFDVSELGIRLFVDAEWEDYARNYDVTISVNTDYDDAGALRSGAMLLVPTEYQGSEGVDTRGGIIAIAVRAEGAEQSVPEGLESYTASALGSEQGYEFTLYENPAPDTSLLSEDGVAMVEAIRASLSGKAAASVQLSRPATKTELSTLIGEFSAQDIYGAAVDRSILENAPYTLIDVWATYCSPCITEMPELAELAKEYEGRVQFIGIVSDATDEDAIELARSIAEQTGVTYTCIVPDSSLYNTLLSRIQYTPTKLVVDQQGVQVGDPMIGAQGKDALKAVLDALPAD